MWLLIKSAKDSELIKGIKKPIAYTFYNPGFSYKGIATQDKSKNQQPRDDICRHEIFNWSDGQSKCRSEWGINVYFHMEIIGDFLPLWVDE